MTVAASMTLLEMTLSPLESLMTDMKKANAGYIWQKNRDLKVSPG